MLTYLELSRRDAGLTQAQLATAAGVHRSTIIAIENGASAPSASSLSKIAAALGRSALVNADQLHVRAIEADPELAPRIRHIGRLLSWLPFDRPADPVWPALDNDRDRGTYLMRKLAYVHKICTATELEVSTNTTSVGLVGELRYILLFVRDSPDTAAALASTTLFQNAQIARLWLSDLTTSAWSVWTVFNAEGPI